MYHKDLVSVHELLLLPGASGEMAGEQPRLRKGRKVSASNGLGAWKYIFGNFLK